MMSNIIEKNKSRLLLSFLLITLIGCGTNKKSESQLLFFVEPNKKIIVDDYEIYITSLEAVYLYVKDKKKRAIIENRRIEKFELLLNNNLYKGKLVKQFFDKTILDKEFSLCVDNMSGYIVVDTLDNKPLYLIGAKQELEKILEKENVLVSILE